MQSLSQAPPPLAQPLASQFTKPAPSSPIVQRPRLDALVRHGLDGPLTVLCAPAGSGKTMLLGAALGGDVPGPLAWLALEEADDDPVRFWVSVLNALWIAGATPPGSALAALAARAGDSTDGFTPLLLKALGGLAQPVVLVLDELRAIRSREGLEQLALLLAHAPAALRIVLCARADPMLPPRSGRAPVEIGAADLAFDVEETAALLVAHGLALPDRLAIVLQQRTEGWAAGLRLAALGLQGRADPDSFVAGFGGDDRAVAEYLVAEVLAHQPAAERGFLLRTSIVEHVCGELADALTGERSGTRTLEAFGRTHGFVIGPDSEGGWLRYHRLLITLLRDLAQHELATELPQLHRRAASWYAQQGDAARALRHAVAASDCDLAVGLVEEHGFDLLVQGEGATLRALGDLLPAERAGEDAGLAAALACAALEAGDADRADARLALASDCAGRLPERRRRAYRDTVALARLHAARLDGDLDAALAAAATLDGSGCALVRAALGEAALWAQQLQRAGDELAAAAELARSAGLDKVEVDALCHLALLAAITEGPAHGARRAGEAIGLAARRQGSPTPSLACAHAALAMAAASGGRLEEASGHLDRAFGAAEGTRARQPQLVLVDLAARVHGALGRPGAGLRALDRFEFAHRTGRPHPAERATLACARARLLAAQGDVDGAAGVLMDVQDEPWPIVELGRARLLLMAGEPVAAAQRLAVAEAAGAGPMDTVAAVEVLVLAAVAHDAAGKPSHAAHALRRALERAERTGDRRPFVEGGRRVEAMLRKQSGAAHGGLVEELLGAFPGRSPERGAVGAPLEPLSEREQAVLGYLPTTLSNREIAAELFVSTNTVKTHLRSIYRKLNVTGRRDAVRRGRDLRLLSGSNR